MREFAPPRAVGSKQAAAGEIGPMIDTRETLLGRLRVENAQEAWKEFYHLYWRAILGYARKLGLDGHQAEEVLQETMVALMRILPEFAYDPSRGKFRNFLLTIVHRKSLAALRRAQRISATHVPWEESEAGGLGHPCEVDSGEAEVRWREVLMAEAIRELRADQTIERKTLAVFEAYVIQKKDAAEVAACHGLKENAVYQIKNRLVRRLQRRVRQLLHDAGANGE
jgi:RNA polymerase sigma-70 factor (ECF subfamily)